MLSPDVYFNSLLTRKQYRTCRCSGYLPSSFPVIHSHQTNTQGSPGPARTWKNTALGGAPGAGLAGGWVEAAVPWRPTSSRGQPRAAEPPTAPVFPGRLGLRLRTLEAAAGPQRGPRFRRPGRRVCCRPPAPSGAAAAPEGTMGGFHPPGPGSLPLRPQRRDKKRELRLWPGFGEGSRPPGAFPSPGPAPEAPALGPLRPSGASSIVVAATSDFQKSRRPEAGAGGRAPAKVQFTGSPTDGRATALPAQCQGQSRKRLQGSVRHCGENKESTLSKVTEFASQEHVVPCQWLPSPALRGKAELLTQPGDPPASSAPAHGPTCPPLCSGSSPSLGFACLAPSSRPAPAPTSASNSCCLLGLGLHTVSSGKLARPSLCS